MAVRDEDVTEEESSASEAQTTEATADSTQAPSVTGETGKTRPVENIVGEMNRKFGKTQQEISELGKRVDALLNYMAQAQQPQYQQPPAPRPAASEVTDEDLWERAKLGDRGAFDEYMARKARREVSQVTSVQNRQSLVASQLQALGAKYPMLNDPSHPLTQTAQTAYQLLVRSGYPAGQETLLEAAKTAIADRPDLVSEYYSQTASAREGVRRSATGSARTGQTGGTVRNEPAAPRAGQARPLTPEQLRLAKQMGVKDPQGARERFLKRREQGISNVGAVGNMLNEEDL